jgi:transposase
MTVTPRDAGDRQLLDELVRRESDARQRDRYRAVLLAMGDEPELEGDRIALRLGRSPRFVDEWVGRYRRGGLGALRPRKQPGRRPKLTPQQGEQLKARLDAGPLDSDGVCALRGKDVCRIIEAEFGVVHTLGGIYDVLRRLGYSSLVPRPRHRKNDPAAMEKFEREGAPLLPAP